MKISSHISGTLIAASGEGGGKKGVKTKSRKQGSLLGYQKRRIANAIEWIRLNATNKPYIFVATCSDKWKFDPAAISKFCHNLKNGYNAKHYVWTREQTKKGVAHYHFVCDFPVPNNRKAFKIFARNLSRAWYRYHNVNDNDLNYNSIRFGSSPFDWREGKKVKSPQGKKRDFYIDSINMAYYMSAYLSKSFEDKNINQAKRFFISGSVNKKEIEPIVYQRQIEVDYETGEIIANVQWPLRITETSYVNQVGETITHKSNGFTYSKVPIKKSEKWLDSKGNELNTSLYFWEKHPLHNVYFGYRKQKILAKKP